MEQALNAVDLNGAAIRYDAAFDAVQGLTWLPWVGRRFAERSPNRRLLVVGESHYYRGDTPEQREADRIGYLKDRQSTREVVSEALVNQAWGRIKTLDTIPKLLFKTTGIDHQRLWTDTAYYNFVQRPMDIYQKEQPTGDDFVAGWRVFSEIVRIIQPSHCLFIGVSAANSFNFSMANLNLSFDNVSWPQKIGTTWARVAKLKFHEMTTELIFVRHLGSYFNWNEWHDYLQSQHVDFMNWLRAESYPITTGEAG
jgi:hypothetical protein